jgi:hypothetical protein
VLRRHLGPPRRGPLVHPRDTVPGDRPGNVTGRAGS